MLHQTIIFSDNNIYIVQVLTYEEGNLDKELSEAGITEPVEDGKKLKETAFKEAQGVRSCTSPIYVQQEVAKGISED